jgi:hypothetical protein
VEESVKNIAVIVNNKREWEFFVEALQFALSKEDTPYKTTTNDIVDKQKDVRYFLVPNHFSGIERMRGVIVNDYMTMANFVDDDIQEYLMIYMRGE